MAILQKRILSGAFQASYIDGETYFVQVRKSSKNYNFEVLIGITNEILKKVPVRAGNISKRRNMGSTSKFQLFHPHQ